MLGNFGNKLVAMMLVCGMFFAQGMAMEKQAADVKPRVGVGVFVFNDGKVLLGRRKGAHGAGDWAPPGGHLEFGESVETCAQRELAEETGLKALSIQTGAWSNDVIDGTKHYITLFAVVDQFEGEPQLLEPHKCEEWQWFSVDALPSPLFPPVHSYFAQLTSAKSQAPHEQVLASLLDFYQAREWEQFHSPKNLVMDLASETGELLDLFRWMSEEQSYHPDARTMQEIRDEVADVFKAVLYLAHRLKIDPIAAAHQKFEKMGQKYPIEQCKGKSLKYTAYEMQPAGAGAQ
jgi:8-oxo-dGTP diphosphatase